MKDDVLFVKSYCVKDFVKDYNSYGGNAYGLANTLKQTAFLRPKIRSKKVNNLFFTGQLTVPGPGVPPSLISGKIETNDSFHTVADGLRTHLGERNFPIIQKYVDKIIRVEEDEIINAMQLIWERMKIIIEPSCAVPFAAVLRNKEEFRNKKIGIILSGGNVDVKNLPF